MACSYLCFSCLLMSALQENLLSEQFLLLLHLFLHLFLLPLFCPLLYCGGSLLCAPLCQSSSPSIRLIGCLPPHHSTSHPTTLPHTPPLYLPPHHSTSHPTTLLCHIISHLSLNAHSSINALLILKLFLINRHLLF